jgi:hypothetical protein
MQTIKQSSMEKEEFEENQIMLIIVALMESAQDASYRIGTDRVGTTQSTQSPSNPSSISFNKKEFVLRKISEILSVDTFNRYRPFISLTIDFIKELSKNKAILGNLVKKSKCSSCLRM